MPERSDYEAYDWEVHFTGGILHRQDFYPDIDDPATTRRDLDPERTVPHPYGIPERIIMIPVREGLPKLTCEIPPGAMPVVCIWEHERGDLSGVDSEVNRWHRIGWNKPGIDNQGRPVWIRVFSLINVRTGEMRLNGVDNEGHRIQVASPDDRRERVHEGKSADSGS